MDEHDHQDDHEHDHQHDDHDHGHDHGHGRGHDPEHGHHEDEEQPDVSAWAARASTTACPACEAPGALMLGGGIFCPACGAVSTSAGFQAAPADDPASED